MKNKTGSLDYLFNPGSVAVIGASREKNKVGRLILENIIRYGFSGEVYPVNPKSRKILGRRSYPSVLDIEKAPDLAVIVIPARFVAAAVEDCVKKGVKAAIIITAGFKEAGLEGARLESSIKKIASEGGLRLLGPNCLGMIDTTTHLNASFARGMPKPGKIAFFSQSGALCQAILDWALGEGIGFSRFISIGNKADIDEVSMLESLAGHKQTSVILGYIEGVSDGERFIKAASRITPRKVVIMTKSGTTQAGARAAASHTGTLTGSETAFNAACEAAGIIRARTIGELFNYALAFASHPLPRGPNLAVITNAGGPGILAADSIENSSINMARLSRKTTDYLHRSLPPSAGVYNPVDLIGDARADRYEKALKAVVADPAVDGALVLLTPQITTEVEKTAQVLVNTSKTSRKPIMANFMGGFSTRKGEEILTRASLPNYKYPEHAVQAFEAMTRYQLRRKEKPEAPEPVRADRRKVKKIIRELKEEGRLQLAENDARPILEAYGFSLIPSVLTRRPKEAQAAAGECGFPVVMKISSEDILHKSDIGGVKLGIENEEDIRSTFEEIMANARRYFPQTIPDGIMVQPMIDRGLEVILGAVRDPVYGPIIMFGLGGIYVEVLKDVSYGLAPLTRRAARKMIKGIKTAIILSGWRGTPPSDMEALADNLLRLSAMMVDFPEILEAEINPLRVFTKGEGALGIDARIIIKED